MARVIPLAVAALFLAAATTWSQTSEIQKKVFKSLFEQKKAEKAKAEAPTLAQMLEEALKKNPDIQAAEVKLREAQAELNRVRLKTLSRIVALHQEIQALQAAKQDAENRFKRIQALRQNNAVSAEEVDVTQIALLKAKAELARVEAEMPYLLGKAPAGMDFGFPLTREPDPRVLEQYAQALSAYREASKPVPGDMAEKIVRILDTPITPDLKDVNFEQAMEYFKKQAKGINVLVLLRASKSGSVGAGPPLDPSDAARKPSLTLKEPVPLGAVLQWIEDQVCGPNGERICLVLRDYGIVVTDSTGVPPFATPLLDYWKKSRARHAPEK